MKEEAGRQSNLPGGGAGRWEVLRNDIQSREQITRG